MKIDAVDPALIPEIGCNFEIKAWDVTNVYINMAIYRVSTQGCYGQIMAEHTHDGELVELRKWDQRTRALLGGLAITSAGFFLIAVVQPQGLDPPPETAALFLVSVSAASLSYLLLIHGAEETGYGLAILTGFYVILSIGVVVSGIYGTGGPRTNPIGPIAWILLSLAVIVSAVYARRERADTL